MVVPPRNAIHDTTSRGTNQGTGSTTEHRSDDGTRQDRVGRPGHRRHGLRRRRLPLLALLLVLAQRPRLPMKSVLRLGLPRTLLARLPHHLGHALKFSGNQRRFGTGEAGHAADSSSSSLTLTLTLTAAPSIRGILPSAGSDQLAGIASGGGGGVDQSAAGAGPFTTAAIAAIVCVG